MKPAFHDLLTGAIVLILIAISANTTWAQDTNGKLLKSAEELQNTVSQLKSADAPDTEQHYVNQNELANAYRRLGSVYEQMHSDDKLLETYQKLVEVDSGLVHVERLRPVQYGKDLKLLADLYSRLGKHNDAADAYGKAITTYYKGSSRQEAEPVYKGLSQELQAIGKSEEGESMLVDFEKNFPRSTEPAPPAPVRVVSGTAGSATKPPATKAPAPKMFGQDAFARPSRLADGNTDWEANAYNQAIGCPEQVEADKLRNSGSAKLKSSKIAQSIMDYQKAVEMLQAAQGELEGKTKTNTPGYPLGRWHASYLKEAQVHKDLAEVYRQMGKVEDVKREYETAVDLKVRMGIPDISQDYLYLASICQLTRDYTSEAYFLRQALSGISYSGGERSDLAVKTLEKLRTALQKSDSPPERVAAVEARLKAIKEKQPSLPDLPRWRR